MNRPDAYKRARGARKGKDTKINRIVQELKEGKDFWEAVREPYLKHELNRDEVKQLINASLKETSGKYADLLKVFNLGKEDYKKFINFLIANDLK